MVNRLVASILDCDFTRLGEEVAAVDPLVDRFQLDVMDGHFVPNLSFGLPILNALRRLTKLPIEADLMIANPDCHAPHYAEAGADFVIFHVEASTHPKQICRDIRGAGGKPGISLSPGTPAESVRPYLGDVAMALVMTVEPGFGGQDFLNSQLDVVRTIRRWVHEDGLDVPVEVDGGINGDTASASVDAGATLLVSGSFIYGSDDYSAAVAALRQQI